MNSLPGSSPESLYWGKVDMGLRPMNGFNESINQCVTAAASCGWAAVTSMSSVGSSVGSASAVREGGAKVTALACACGSIGDLAELNRTLSPKTFSNRGLLRMEPHTSTVASAL